MSAFKPKRVTGADLAAQLSGATVGMPSSTPSASSPSHSPTRPAPLPVVQINFKASEAFARLVAIEGEKAGSTRRFFAKLLRDAGYDVPEGDVNPPDTRRRWIAG